VFKGGRGRAGAGRRGEDGETYMFYMNYIYKEEGAVREPVGGGRRGNYFYIEWHW